MKTYLSLASVAILLLCQAVVVADDDDKGKGKNGKRGAGDPEAMFKRMDADGNGKVTKEEYTKFQEAVQEKLKDKGKGGAGKGAGLGDRLFTMMDADKDGSITLDEFKKAREKMAERGGKAKGKGKDPK